MTDGSRWVPFRRITRASCTLSASMTTRSGVWTIWYRVWPNGFGTSGGAALVEGQHFGVVNHLQVGGFLVGLVQVTGEPVLG